MIRGNGWNGDGQWIGTFVDGGNGHERGQIAIEGRERKKNEKEQKETCKKRENHCKKHLEFTVDL